MRVRWQDRGGVRAAWGRWGRDIVVAVAVGLAAWSLLLERKGREDRLDQSCTIFEMHQKDDVDALSRTYRYLAGLSGGELAQPINRAILANLPRTVREAQLDDAPAYCDEPGRGLPEPDPRVPDRPVGLPDR